MRASLFILKLSITFNYSATPSHRYRSLDFASSQNVENFQKDIRKGKTNIGGVRLKKEREEDETVTSIKTKIIKKDNERKVLLLPVFFFTRSILFFCECVAPVLCLRFFRHRATDRARRTSSCGLRSYSRY